MYGEKVEQSEELLLDLQDVKDMYKSQVHIIILCKHLRWFVAGIKAVRNYQMICILAHFLDCCYAINLPSPCWPIMRLGVKYDKKTIERYTKWEI